MMYVVNVKNMQMYGRKKMGKVKERLIEDMIMNPIPNHCMECDTPTMDTLCDKCKEKEMEEDDE